jgi:hypothetical protein
MKETPLSARSPIAPLACANAAGRQHTLFHELCMSF